MSFLNGLRRTFGLSTVPQQPSEYDLMKQREAQSMAEAQAVSAHAQNTLDHGAFDGERMPLQQRLQTPAQENYGNEGRGVKPVVQKDPRQAAWEAQAIRPAAPQPAATRSASGQLQISGYEQGGKVGNNPDGTPTSWGKRADGSAKGYGYFGELPMADGKGVATEMGADDGQGFHYPLINPMLNRAELDHLLSGARPTDAIYDKAEAHARQRMEKGLSPFAHPDEAPLPMPEPEVDPLSQIRAQVRQKRGY